MKKWIKKLAIRMMEVQLKNMERYSWSNGNLYMPMFRRKEGEDTIYMVMDPYQYQKFESALPSKILERVIIEHEPHMFWIPIGKKKKEEWNKAMFIGHHEDGYVVRIGNFTLNKVIPHIQESEPLNPEDKGKPWKMLKYKIPKEVLK